MLMMVVLVAAIVPGGRCLSASQGSGSAAPDNDVDEPQQQQQQEESLHKRGITASGNAGFYVEASNTIPSGAQTWVQGYNTVLTNMFNDLGGNMNFATGFFNAPVDGYYAFSATALFGSSAQAGSQRTIMISTEGLTLSGVLAIQSLSKPGPRSIALTTSNSHVYLLAGQRINVVVTHDVGHDLNVVVLFSGHLVSQG